MEIKKGYKMTDVGVIPEDWDVKSIGEMYSFKNGLNKDKDSFGFGTPIINYMDVYKNNGLTSKCIKGKVSLSDYEISYFLVKKGDVFFTRTSETPEEVGIASVLLDELPKGVFSGFLLRARPNGNDIEPLLCKYIFTTESFRSSVIQNSTYTTRALTNGAILSSLYVAFPKSIVEQQAIADALTKVDNLITSLTKVIEKKKLIKKGTMQKLLSGEMRLDGFDVEWERKQIGKIGITYSGITGKNKSDFGHGTAKYITFLNVLNNPIINTKELELVDISSNENQNKAVKGDLFFNVSSETPEEVGICSVLLDDINNLYVNSFCFGFRITDKEVSGIYLSYLFRTSLGRDKMSSIAQGATRYNLSKDYFNEIELTMPPSKAEQTAIANILITMDNEIEALEKERDKYKCIKQGMMQQLLTGKIRLTCQ